MSELQVPPNPAEIVEALKAATGWNRVNYTGEVYMLDLHVRDRSKIKGLTINGDNLALSFPEFHNIPLCINLRIGAQDGPADAVHQYYSVGGRLQRPNGKPTYIAIGEGRCVRRWHWGGVVHRTEGPAKEMTQALSVSDIPGFDGHKKHSWEYMSLEWYREGFLCRYPAPSKATIKNGWKLVKDGKLNSPRDDLAAWGADHVEIVWDSPAFEDANHDMFLPKRLVMDNVVEFYDEGVYRSRDCDLSDFTWYRRGETIEADTITKFNEVTRDMIADFGLWSAPFYKDAGHEFALLTEFDRVGRDEGVD